MFKTQLQIGGNTLDFFDDEHINLSTSIDDAIELATSLTSFTKEFTVPATHINNTVFKDYWNIHIVEAPDTGGQWNGNPHQSIPAFLVIS